MQNRLVRLLAELRELLLYGSFSRRSYAQEGEDLILDRIFGASTTGFYVDIGAHHPVRFSNTFLFYKRGWHGICIDPSPDTAKLFKKVRPRDIALEMGISDCEKSLTYIVFDEPALNTFSEELADQRVKQTSYQIVDKRQVLVYPLSKVLDEFLIDKSSIDFMTIDVEGLDLEVLRSNNWNKYRPRCVLAEALSDGVGNSIREFMQGVDYKCIARTFNTEFYIDNRFESEAVH